MPKIVPGLSPASPCFLEKFNMLIFSDNFDNSRRQNQIIQQRGQFIICVGNDGERAGVGVKNRDQKHCGKSPPCGGNL
jgi:hypothetical protein